MNGIRLLYYQTEYPANTVCLEAFQALGCAVEAHAAFLLLGYQFLSISHPASSRKPDLQYGTTVFWKYKSRRP